MTVEQIDDMPPLRVGTIVKHNTYGFGIVVPVNEVEEELLTRDGRVRASFPGYSALAIVRGELAIVAIPVEYHLNTGMQLPRFAQ